MSRYQGPEYAQTRTRLPGTSGHLGVSFLAYRTRRRRRPVVGNWPDNGMVEGPSEDAQPHGRDQREGPVGLARPTIGRAEIFGLDCPGRTVEVHRRLAYVPGEANLWPSLTGAETLHLLGRVQGRVDVGYQDELIQRFELDPSKKVRADSKGNKQKVWNRRLATEWLRRPMPAGRCSSPLIS